MTDLSDIFADALRQSPHVHWNLSVAELIEQAVQRGEGILTSTGALRVTTGKYTGRSPRDKFLVDSDITHYTVEWGQANQPMSAGTFDTLADKMGAFARERELFVFDGFAGSDPRYQIPIRVITEYAWHNLFARQLFVRPDSAIVAAGMEQGMLGDCFLLIDLPSFKADPPVDGTRSEVVVALDLERRFGLIGGTEYAGEIKKSLFTVMNFLLPQEDVLPMHCSANAGADGRVALFFGLSGTGKTTLSADPERELIGDDEHGWSDYGIFNFEGGCYAKCVRLSYRSEPEIWNAIKFGAVLENVLVDKSARIANYDDTSLTENTRCAYPIEFIPHARVPGIGGHPSAILFLTADAFGVLPPIARLTREQAMYHFLSGYTSKLAGTERGVTEPEPIFSACFGAPFWPLPPQEYANMLGRRLDEHAATCYLINTGWSGGRYGVGTRINLAYTRAIVHAAIAGELNDVTTVTDPVFGLHIPTRVPDVPDTILQPWLTWPDRKDYDTTARLLADQFQMNFSRFRNIDEAIKAAGPIPDPSSGSKRKATHSR